MPTYYSPQPATVISVLNNYFPSLVTSFLNGLVLLIVAIVVFLIGWLVAGVLREVVAFILSRVKFKEWLQAAGLGKYIEDFQWEERLDHILAEIVFWVVLLVFLMASLEVLGLQVVNSFIQNVVNYLPKAISGGLILVAGFILGEIVRKVLVGVLHGLDKKSARGVAIFVKWAIVVFAVLAAFNQWGIASEIVNILTMGVVLFVALAGGLAFGLGGQEIAREFLEDIKNKFK
jgi:hypothetical protein